MSNEEKKCKYDNDGFCQIWGTKICEKGFDCSEEKIEREYFRGIERD